MDKSDRDYKSVIFEIEKSFLSPYAAKSYETKGRVNPIPESPMRNPNLGGGCIHLFDSMHSRLL